MCARGSRGKSSGYHIQPSPEVTCKGEIAARCVQDVHHAEVLMTGKGSETEE